MNIKICDKCKGFDYKKIIEEIDKLGIENKYEIGCNSMCGIGRNNIVAIVNNKPIISKNVNELLNTLLSMSNDNDMEVK